MIDLTKSPEGATHYSKYPVRYFKYSNDKKDMYYFTVDGFVKLDHWPRHGTVFKIPDWNIYNNTKPLSELSDEQRGLLFNYHFNGGVIVSHASAELKSPTWGADVVYRAKQKSERELFIEATLLATKPFSMDVEIVEAIAKDMFNAGFKAPEDKQC